MEGIPPLNHALGNWHRYLKHPGTTRVLRQHYPKNSFPFIQANRQGTGIQLHGLAGGIEQPQTLLHASEIEERYQLSFWDALIVAAAYQGGSDKILTEDLNHGQVIEGLKIENPFI